MVLAGVISIFKLPVAEYPEIAPPSLYVMASYPGKMPWTEEPGSLSSIFSVPGTMLGTVEVKMSQAPVPAFKDFMVFRDGHTSTQHERNKKA